ncbi:MAG: J domain-containing protein [Nitrospinota bacterium]
MKEPLPPLHREEAMGLNRLKAYYERLSKARELMKLEERVSLREVKEAYRTLARSWHPDQVGHGQRAEAEERMKALNEAYELLMDYCERYPVPFSFDSLRETDPLYDHFRRFYHDFFADAYTDDESSPS